MDELITKFKVPSHLLSEFAFFFFFNEIAPKIVFRSLVGMSLHIA